MKESEPSSEQTNGQSSESKSDDKVVEKSDGAQNGEKAISKPKNEAKGKSLKAPGSSSGEKVDSVADDADCCSEPPWVGTGPLACLLLVALDLSLDG